MGLTPRATSTWHSSWTLYPENASHTIWGLKDPNKLSADLKGKKFMCKSCTGFQESKVQTYSSFPKREMKVGVCWPMHTSFRAKTCTGTS